MPYVFEEPGIEGSEIEGTAKLKEALGEMGILGDGKNQYLEPHYEQWRKDAVAFDHDIITNQLSNETRQDIANKKYPVTNLYDQLMDGEIPTGQFSARGKNVGSIDTLDKYFKTIRDRLDGLAGAFSQTRSENDKRDLNRVAAELLYNLETMGQIALDEQNPAFAKKALELTGYLDGHSDVRVLLETELKEQNVSQ